MKFSKEKILKLLTSLQNPCPTCNSKPFNSSDRDEAIAFIKSRINECYFPPEGAWKKNAELIIPDWDGTEKSIPICEVWSADGTYLFQEIEWKLNHPPKFSIKQYGLYCNNSFALFSFWRINR